MPLQGIGVDRQPLDGGDRAAMNSVTLQRLRELAEEMREAPVNVSKVVALLDAVDQHNCTAPITKQLDRLEGHVAQLRRALMQFDNHHPPMARGFFCAGCDLDGENPAKTSTHHDPDCEAARAALATTGDEKYLEKYVTHLQMELAGYDQARRDFPRTFSDAGLAARDAKRDADLKAQWDKEFVADRKALEEAQHLVRRLLARIDEHGAGCRASARVQNDAKEWLTRDLKPLHRANDKWLEEHDAKLRKETLVCASCGKTLVRGPIGGGHFDYLECKCTKQTPMVDLCEQHKLPSCAMCSDNWGRAELAEHQAAVREQTAALILAAMWANEPDPYGRRMEITAEAVQTADALRAELAKEKP